MLQQACKRFEGTDNTKHMLFCPVEVLRGLPLPQQARRATEETGMQMLCPLYRSQNYP